MDQEGYGKPDRVYFIELNIPMSCYGLIHLPREDKQKGLEPDECYYLSNAPRVRGMRNRPAIHPAPNLASK